MAEPAAKPPYLEALLASWVPARLVRAQERCIGITPGGGRRLNAAMLHGDEDPTCLRALAAAMASLGADGVFQAPLGSAAAERLQAMGYSLAAPTAHYTLPTTHRLTKAPGLEIYVGPAPLALLRRFWAQSGTNAIRQGAMQRAQNPRFVMVRADKALAGAAFLGGDGDLAMMHAVEVAPEWRGQGVGRTLVAACLEEARHQGAAVLNWLTEDSNDNAHGAFSRLGGVRHPGYGYALPPCPA